MLRSLFTTISNIDYQSPDEVTSEYLDQRYIDLYNLRYNTLEPDGMHRVLSSDTVHDLFMVFGVELSAYLCTQGLDVTKVDVKMYGFLSIPVLNLELSGKHLAVVQGLALQREEPPVVRYQVLPPMSNCIVYGTANLVGALHTTLGYYDCEPCHYSDRDNRHCGLGRDMYTRDCSGRVSNTIED